MTSLRTENNNKKKEEKKEKPEFVLSSPKEEKGQSRTKSKRLKKMLAATQGRLASVQKSTLGAGQSGQLLHRVGPRLRASTSTNCSTVMAKQRAGAEAANPGITLSCKAGRYREVGHQPGAADHGRATRQGDIIGIRHDHAPAAWRQLPRTRTCVASARSPTPPRPGFRWSTSVPCLHLHGPPSACRRWAPAHRHRQWRHFHGQRQEHPFDTTTGDRDQELHHRHPAHVNLLHPESAAVAPALAIDTAGVIPDRLGCVRRSRSAASASKLSSQYRVNAVSPSAGTGLANLGLIAGRYLPHWHTLTFASLGGASPPRSLSATATGGSVRH